MLVFLIDEEYNTRECDVTHCVFYPDNRVMWGVVDIEINGKPRRVRCKFYIHSNDDDDDTVVSLIAINGVICDDVTSDYNQNCDHDCENYLVDGNCEYCDIHSSDCDCDDCVNKLPDCMKYKGDILICTKTRNRATDRCSVCGGCNNCGNSCTC